MQGQGGPPGTLGEPGTDGKQVTNYSLSIFNVFFFIQGHRGEMGERGIKGAMVHINVLVIIIYVCCLFRERKDLLDRKDIQG